MSSNKWFPAKGETGVVGRFEVNHDRPNIPESKKADEFVPMEMIVCRMKVVTDPDESVVPVKPHNKDQLIARFPDAWKDFNGEAIEVDGTPLSELGLDENRILGFRLNAITTVEQLAVLSDAQCETAGLGTKKIRQSAQTYLAEKAGQEQRAVVEAAAALVKPKRGRPSNAERAARAVAN